MAIGSIAPCADHEKNVCLRLSSTISALDIVLADSTAMKGSRSCVRRARLSHVAERRPTSIPSPRGGYHSAAVTAPSLWRHTDFLKLWAGQTVSELGSVVTRTAGPLVALLALGAGPLEMALIVVAGSLAVLLVGFFAGAWVDRVRRRPPRLGPARARRPA